MTLADEDGPPELGDMVSVDGTRSAFVREPSVGGMVFKATPFIANDQSHRFHHENDLAILYNGQTDSAVGKSDDQTKHRPIPQPEDAPI